MSAAGCSGAACHGNPTAPSLSNGPNGSSWKYSATHWAACDPHAGAYDALARPGGEAIHRRLRKAAPQAWAASAVEDPRCLACHTNPTLAGDTFGDARVIGLRAEGVGCEACHGNASDWLHMHTTLDARAADLSGMIRLNDLGERAMACAGCHVGAPADPDRGVPVRDMNHQMIAAGHPRLAFEFAEHLWRLPPHWLEKDRKLDGAPPRGPEFDATAWLIGRLATAEAAYRLLADRADRSTRKAAPWPEFAESSCSACHHDLRPDGWTPSKDSQVADVPPWQTLWPVSQTDQLTALAERPNLEPRVTAAVTEVKRLRELLETAERPHAETVRTAATAAGTALSNVRTAVSRLPPREAARLAASVFRRTQVDDLDREAACQVLQGLAALERTRCRLTPAKPAEPDGVFRQAYDVLARPLREQRPARSELQAHLAVLLRSVPAGVHDSLK